MTETITGEWEAALAELRDTLAHNLPHHAVVTITVELTGEGHLSAGAFTIRGEVQVTAPATEDEDSWYDEGGWKEAFQEAAEEAQENGPGRVFSSTEEWFNHLAGR